MKGFRDFILRGNLLELAVAFIMGAAFGDVVKSFTGIILGVIAKVLGGDPTFGNVPIAGINVGPFLTALASFLLIALVVYFGLVKPFTALRERLKKADEETAAPSEVDVLTEIRDLLAGAAPRETPAA